MAVARPFDRLLQQGVCQLRRNNTRGVGAGPAAHRQAQGYYPSPARPAHLAQVPRPQRHPRRHWHSAARALWQRDERADRGAGQVQLTLRHAARELLRAASPRQDLPRRLSENALAHLGHPPERDGQHHDLPAGRQHAHVGDDTGFGLAVGKAEDARARRQLVLRHRPARPLEAQRARGPRPLRHQALRHATAVDLAAGPAAQARDRGRRALRLHPAGAVAAGQPRGA
mmetsp:Transcript_41419/g.134328  ORF Transcript_41419/g.134328 Transcript_41419/m.134328 type:complete len:228 (+) Transcript_41419:254-937(+)